MEKKRDRPRLGFARWDGENGQDCPNVPKLLADNSFSDQFIYNPLYSTPQVWVAMGFGVLASVGLELDQYSLTQIVAGGLKYK